MRTASHEFLLRLGVLPDCGTWEKNTRVERLVPTRKEGVDAAAANEGQPTPSGSPCGSATMQGLQSMGHSETSSQRVDVMGNGVLRCCQWFTPVMFCQTVHQSCMHLHQAPYMAGYHKTGLALRVGQQCAFIEVPCWLRIACGTPSPLKDGFACDVHRDGQPLRESCEAVVPGLLCILVAGLRCRAPMPPPASTWFAACCNARVTPLALLLLHHDHAAFAIRAALSCLLGLDHGRFGFFLHGFRESD